MLRGERVIYVNICIGECSKASSDHTSCMHFQRQSIERDTLLQLEMVAAYFAINDIDERAPLHAMNNEWAFLLPAFSHSIVNETAAQECGTRANHLRFTLPSCLCVLLSCSQSRRVLLCAIQITWTAIEIALVHMARKIGRVARCRCLYRIQIKFHAQEKNKQYKNTRLYVGH